MAEHVARAGKSSAKHLSQEISEALRERRWSEASTLLADLSKSAATNVKLGSLQRWTRDADACVDDGAGACGSDARSMRAMKPFT